MTTDHKAQVEAARIECHKARRETCGAWSNVMTGPHAVLPDDMDAKCDKAQAAETILREAIDSLAILASAPPALQESQNEAHPGHRPDLLSTGVCSDSVGDPHSVFVGVAAPPAPAAGEPLVTTPGQPSKGSSMTDHKAQVEAARDECVWLGDAYSASCSACLTPLWHKARSDFHAAIDRLAALASAPPAPGIEGNLNAPLWENLLGSNRVPLTQPQIDDLYRKVSAEVSKLELEERYTFAGWFPVAVREIEAAHGIDRAALRAPDAPIDMVLHCPACGLQHIDAPEPPRALGYVECDGMPGMAYSEAWTNPPHKSHLCHGCGHIFRPADVPTNGVAAVKTKGSADSQLIPGRACTALRAPDDAIPPERKPPCVLCAGLDPWPNPGDPIIEDALRAPESKPA